MQSHNLPTSQSIKQLINQLIINQSINQAINQSINQPIVNQSINQSINQPIQQISKLLTHAGGSIQPIVWPLETMNWQLSNENRGRLKMNPGKEKHKTI